ncbi:serine/threonine-protein kinase haspin-like [Clytia hemisphaerica]|uniref:serine/threonine-protein kinase haspin-like n=1 Tax=Clytia hemisphaerica TaxID=252671 RepID=UPI0034D67944
MTGDVIKISGEVSFGEVFLNKLDEEEATVLKIMAVGGDGQTKLGDVASEIAINRTLLKFNKAQKYVVFEYEHGGEQLESFKPSKTSWTIPLAFNVLQQITILKGRGRFSRIRAPELPRRKYPDSGNTSEIQDYVGVKDVEFPNKILLVTIIDFTLSRLKSEDCVIFTDLSTENNLFTGTCDAQFDVIRKIREDNGLVTLH